MDDPVVEHDLAEYDPTTQPSADGSADGSAASLPDENVFADLRQLGLGDRVDILGTSRHSVTRRARRARIPQTAEQRAAPLHVHRMSPLDVDAVREYMAPSVRRRFDEVWDVMFSPPTPEESAALRADDSTRRGKPFGSDHARMMAEPGVDVAEPATGPGPLRCTAFTVYEEREAGMRGCERSAALTAPVTHALRILRSRGVGWDIAYIRTDLNPSDRPSRVFLESWSAADEAHVVRQVHDFFAS